MLDVSVAVRGVTERCFKCPKDRQRGDPGWYFVDLDDAQRLLGRCRLYVCPEDYLKFAVSERNRWIPLADGEHPANGARAQIDAAGAAQETAPCNADELISLLADRGLAGWAFFVRDVAAGRVRRVHLRQLPAEPELRRALVAFLHRAGTVVTVSQVLQDQQRRVEHG